MNTAELVKEATKKATKQATEETMNDGIKKSIRMERKAGLTEATILDGLIAEYGSNFTEAELKQIMKETKQ